jgi:hypothetical protein
MQLGAIATANAQILLVSFTLSLHPCVPHVAVGRESFLFWIEKMQYLLNRHSNL